MCVWNHLFIKIWLVMFSLIVSVSGTPASAQILFEDQKLLASDGAPNDRFGWSVDIDGDWAVVGNRGKQAAYMYQFDGTTWVERQKLEKPGFNLGFAVAIDGDWALVGALNGSAVIFRLDGSTWIEEQRLFAPQGAGDYGFSMDIKGDMAIVGARRGDGAVVDSGSAAVYRFDEVTSTWVEEAELFASDGAFEDLFGEAVAIDGDFAVVGAYNDDPPSGGDFSYGAAYVFHFDGVDWVEQRKLAPFDVTEQTRWFGKSVDIDGPWISVGSRDEWVYMFQYDGVNWVDTQKITGSDALPISPEVGTSVALDGNQLVVGQGFLSCYNQAWVFNLDGVTWVEQHKPRPSDTTACFGNTQGSGHAVGISGNHVIIGAYADPVGGVEIGAAYIYTVTPPGPVYSCVGFEQPVGSEPITVRRKRAIPLKAQLLDMEGIPVTSDNISAQPVLQVLFSAQTGDDPIDVTADALAVGLGTDGNQFVFEDERWRYNLKTTLFTAPGTYLISMVSGDQYNIAPTCQGTFVINE